MERRKFAAFLFHFQINSYICIELKYLIMDIQTVVDLISNLGFPVAMCGALFYYMIKQNEKHENEVEKLSETLNANTKVLTELTTLIKTLIGNEKR